MVGPEAEINGDRSGGSDAIRGWMDEPARSGRVGSVTMRSEGVRQTAGDFAKLPTKEGKCALGQPCKVESMFGAVVWSMGHGQIIALTGTFGRSWVRRLNWRATPTR